MRHSDWASMGDSLELRTPLVDAKLLESLGTFVSGFAGDAGKAMLARSPKKPLPRSIVNRLKTGFTLPFDPWMRSGLKPMLDEVLSDGKGLAQLGVSAEFGQAVWYTFNKNPRKERWSRPWALYVFKRWCQLNNVGL